MDKQEIFNLLQDTEFVDRHENDKERAVDVIIPVLNTNPLFEKSLINFYKRIPINRLIIGDGGCKDNSIEIIQKFPRTIILNQHDMKSLGYRIRKLIETCETEFFIYLHADVFLPENWFDTMYSYRLKHSFFESGRKYVSVIVWGGEEITSERAYSGSQFGKTKVLQEKLSVIDDDYLYRNEDIIISELIDKENYSRHHETFHYHQILSKQGAEEPSINVTPTITRSSDPEWEKWVFEWQWKGIVKYCDPKPYLVENVKASMNVLRELKVFNSLEAKEWVQKTNPKWIPYIKKNKLRFWRR
ncbi:MAG: glycosyltransferase [Candidatus Hodarchaeales archaeon]|jgi:hypothetical protein